MRLELFHNGNYISNLSALSIKEIKGILVRREAYFKHLIERKEFVELLQKTNINGSMPPIRGKWKCSYISAEIDSKRTLITKSELCGRKWIFRFKQWDSTHPGVMASFGDDYKYRSEIFEIEMNWRFYAGAIQVEQYPPITTFRTKNWGWGIENDFVIYHEKVDQP
jgi:hypothetical protein